MIKTSFKMCAVLGFAAGLGAGQAFAGTLYDNEAAFLGDAGPLNFESFESASGSGTSIDVGDFVVNDTSLSIESGTSTSTHHATDGSQYLYHGGGGNLSMTFDSAIDAVGFYLTDLFWTATGPEVVVTTDTGEIINTGVSEQTSEAYIGIIADSLFTSLTIALQAGDGVGLDSVSYGVVESDTVLQDEPLDEGSQDGGEGQDSRSHAVPTPAAGFAGLALLGLLAARRRRHA
ncbi:MAG: hypothetical protein GVY24_06870 [Planctomycetes bacterium]|jgi:MYXO-CTERM domain-containing protein|nr:hypothetical protein [Planctomycetota bacterium]